MAGTYPDVPGPRIPYDRNLGAVLHAGVGTPGSSFVQYTYTTAAQLATVNDESNTVARLTNTGGIQFAALLLHEACDVVGYLIRASAAGVAFPCSILTSVDTTDGLNGTWVERVVSPAPQLASDSQGALRSVNVVNWTNVRGVRLQAAGNVSSDGYLSTFHLYGTPTAAALSAQPHRLRLWHPTLDQPLGGADLDLGDLKQGVTGIKSFRVKNASTTQSANTVSLSREVLTDAAMAAIAEYNVNFNGGAYGTTATVGTLAPGAISAVCNIRRVVGAAAAVQPMQVRLIAAATSWT